MSVEAAGFLPGLFVVLFLPTVYIAAYQDWIDRAVLFAAAAITVIYAGSYLKFYDWETALSSLAGKSEVFCFLLGMNIITVILSEGGLFDTLAKKIALATRGDAWSIMVCFCLLTYGVSLLVNNLTAMLVLIPILLSLSRYLRFNPKIHLVGMVVASNLGGASTMIGDFPNMLIAAETGIGFSRFIAYMMPICLLQLLVLLAYMRYTSRELFVRPAKNPSDLPLPDGDPAEAFFARLREELASGFKNAKAVRRGLLILGALLIGFLVSERLHIPPALIALGGGLLALFVCGINPGRVLARLNYKDLVFFAGLFILVGAAEASGLLNLFGEILDHLSFRSPLLRCLLLMWSAALATAFLNAGPSAAFFLPLVIGLNTPAPHYLYFWSLSLGVLAGSSATLAGATAGSVTATMLEAHSARLHRSGEINGDFNLSFREYARIGAPLAFIFLVMSSAYITVVYRYV